MILSTTSRISGIVLIIVLVGGGYQTYRLSRVTAEKRATEASLAEATERITTLTAATKTLSDTITSLTADKQTLDSLLTTEQRKSQAYKNQIGEITNTVDTLTKLTTTDKELLQKYSRVFFLSENYIPSDLTTIDTKYLYAKNKPLQIHDRVWPFLKHMLDDANNAGVPVHIISAYRSFDTQETLKSNYKVIYGAGTSNQFSADQGYSEHQLGTTIDLTTPALAAGFENFERTTAYTWLQAHAHEYGFILSYPKNNKFYQSEPWHWRFVGIALATRLHKQDSYFYELDQRDIDSYLINIFNASGAASATSSSSGQQ